MMMSRPTRCFLRFLTALSIYGLVSINPQIATAAASETQTREINSLLNWAVYLSQYEKPAALPEVKFVDHEYLVLHACYARECNVVGWYNDQDIIYLDKSIKALDTLLERSIVVHELVHFLQHKSKRFSDSCTDTIKREREAYEIQRQYFYAYGALSPVRQHTHHCKPENPPAG